MRTISHEEMSPKEVALGIVERLEKLWNVDLKSIITNEALTEDERLKKLRARMVEAALSNIDQLHDEVGHQLTDNEDDALLQRVLAEKDIETEPNICVLRSNYEIIRRYQGKQVYDYVFNLSKRMEAMAQAKTPGQLAVQTVGSTLFSVGTAWAKLTWSAWRGGQTLLQATRTGITSLGMKTAVTAVVLVLAVILLYLFLENPKKILGVMYNDTDQMLVVQDWQESEGNLYMEHGEMKNFMSDYATGNLDSPKVQMKSRFLNDPSNPNNPEDVIFGGLYFSDRKFGLRGTEGLIVFNSPDSSLIFAHQFAVPYTKDNGTFMQVLRSIPSDLSGLFREMYNQRVTRFDKNEGGFRMTSTVNDPRGGVVGLIATISQR
ncbi:hypothetical protein L4174_019230 [Photobacterium sp. CCB-ST2H9]|uniref:hypothetical protein n=1 Tax=Photobacterium sp. CCB-ST2H9 TaxID=2912855 RepID=UPI0020052C97|nr:hypothetical protein [Photobacterium sp. CCB-ST2H9]UTM60192.1 hypothetical protein L4174_019230 [Photobacterium sp. CCB-ST2H9]